MQCPKCQSSSLESFTIHKTEVDRCPACTGIWFDEGELRRLAKLEAKGLKPLIGGKEQAALDEKIGNCPRDGKKLLRVYRQDDHSLILDTCATCGGIWLDGGEFERFLGP